MRIQYLKSIEDDDKRIDCLEPPIDLQQIDEVADEVYRLRLQTPADRPGRETHTTPSARTTTKPQRQHENQIRFFLGLRFFPLIVLDCHHTTHRSPKPSPKSRSDVSSFILVGWSGKRSHSEANSTGLGKPRVRGDHHRIHQEDHWIPQFIRCLLSRKTCFPEWTTH